MQLGCKKTCLQNGDESSTIPTVNISTLLPQSIKSKVKELKCLAYDLYQTVNKSTLTPEGFGKLKRKVLKELQHLQTLDENTTYKSCNIHYLNSIWQTIVDEGNAVCAVFKKFKYIAEAADDNEPFKNLNEINNCNTQQMSYAEYNSVPRRHRTADGKFKKAEIIVDIVCNDGLRWIKVKTSNPYSMQMQFINCGSSSKGKNIITMGNNFINASNQHQVYFQPPKIEFVFAEGITSDLAYILREKSIVVKGKEIKEDFLYVSDDQRTDDEDDNEQETKNNNEDSSTEPNTLNETCVNLGVRTMLTMISSLTNNEINSTFFDDLQRSLLEKQADIINEKFAQKNNGKKKKRKPNKTSVVNLDFEYCDFPNYEKTNLISDLNCELNVNENNENKYKDRICEFTPGGYTIGHSQKLKISPIVRKKIYSEKSYEEQKMLLQMYIDEMQSPVLPTIQKCIEGKTLICCETSWNHFMDIVNLSAGPNEWKRCKQLQNKIIIVKDNISERTYKLNGKSMSHINKCIFGTGDSLKIITVTGIASFVRKAEQQGVKYFVHIHPVRALIERYQFEYEKKKGENEKQNIKQITHNTNKILVEKDINQQINENQDEIIVIEDELHESETNENLFTID